MTEQLNAFRTCAHCGREYTTAEELYDLYAAVSLAINVNAVLVDTAQEVEFCPTCGQDF